MLYKIDHWQLMGSEWVNAEGICEQVDAQRMSQWRLKCKIFPLSLYKHTRVRFIRSVIIQVIKPATQYSQATAETRHWHDQNIATIVHGLFTFYHGRLNVTKVLLLLPQHKIDNKISTSGCIGLKNGARWSLESKFMELFSRRRWRLYRLKG